MTTFSFWSNFYLFCVDCMSCSWAEEVDMKQQRRRRRELAVNIRSNISASCPASLKTKENISHRRQSKKFALYKLSDNGICGNYCLLVQPPTSFTVECDCAFFEWEYCAGVGTVSFLSVSTIFTYKAAKCWYQRPHYIPLHRIKCEDVH